MTPAETLASSFPTSAAIDRAAAPDARMNWEDIPAKCAVYVLATSEESSDAPLLLATVGNLRAALQRRLSDVPPDIKTKRIQYGQICSRVYYRIVHSAFAADYFYWSAARTLFPATYKEIIPHRSTWWLALDRETQFPRIRRTSDLSDPSLLYAGPIREKSSATKLIETAEDLFDLCRYHNILVQAPHGKPCAYKEMGKCAAPCDGSVPMTAYDTQIRAAFNFLAGIQRDDWFTHTQLAMRSAAAAQEFELANRIKQRLSRANFIHNESFSFLRPLENFSYLTLQPGQGRAHLEPWLIHGGHIQQLPQLKRKELASTVPQLFTQLQEKTKQKIPASLDIPAMEQIAIVAHHLFRAEKNDGRFLRTSDLLSGGPSMLLSACEACFAEWNPPKPLIEQSSESPPAPQSTDVPTLAADPPSN